MEEFDINDRLRNNIVLLRKSRDLNQNQLGEILGYSDKSVSKWELKESVPDIFTLSKIAKYFDVTVDDLLYSDNIVRKSHKKKNRKLITIVSMCGPFFLAAIVFLVLALRGIDKAYISWIAAISISGIVGVIFSSLWYKPIHLIISCYLIILPLAIITMILLSFKYWWAVLLVALSLCALLTIGFKIKPKNKIANKNS